MTMKPGTRCECRDNGHLYDETRPYARHNVGTCPKRAVRMVTVLVVPPLYEDLYLCAACAEHHERKGA